MPMLPSPGRPSILSRKRLGTKPTGALIPKPKPKVAAAAAEADETGMGPTTKGVNAFKKLIERKRERATR